MDDMMSAWGCSSLFNILEKGNDGASVLTTLASQFLKMCIEQKDNLAELKSHTWDSIRMVYDTVMRIQRFCKCVLYLLDVAYDTTGDQISPINHVLFFTSYSGKLIFERTVKAMFAEGFWRGLMEETVKTSASTKTLEPKMNTVTKILGKSSSLTLEDFVSVMEILPELEAGMRKVSVHGVKNEFLKRVQEKGKEILQETVTSQTNSLIRVVLRGLRSFEAVPGVLDLKNEIEHHMTVHKGAIASMELIGLIEGMIKLREFDSIKLLEGAKSCDRATVPEALLASMDSYLFEFAQLTSSQASGMDLCGFDWRLDWLDCI